MNIGDLIGVNGASGNHGCRDWAILKYLGDGKAECVDGDSCTSCWQVGHGRDHEFGVVGKVWEIDEDSVLSASNRWDKNILWEM